jgi:predicted nicotinamide N-methyase
MLDPAARTVDVTIASREFSVVQSPGILRSGRQGGTTGAAVWQASLRLAEWFCWPENPLDVLLEQRNGTALELGSGISGIVPCVLAPRLRRFVATDQGYLLKTLRENIENNKVSMTSSSGLSSKRHASSLKSHIAPSHRPPRRVQNTRSLHDDNIAVLPLDWETDDVASFMSAHDLAAGVDLLLASDCIYNYALIDAFVQTCTQICQQRRRQQQQQDHYEPRNVATDPDSEIIFAATVLLVAQQMRQPEVFEQWLETTMRTFRVWRVPDDLLMEGFRTGTGFALHLAILKD